MEAKQTNNYKESQRELATGVRLFAAAESPVITIRNAAANARISVTKLRGNVSVLEGSGGNQLEGQVPSGGDLSH
jgi:hypothetical protein